MGYIYKITNKINGKVYIGQTIRTIKTRWNEHVKYSYCKGKSYFSILHCAIRKYGEDAFMVEEVEECPDTMLEEREIYWIDKYNSIKEGYNIYPGHKGWHKCSDKEVLDCWNSGIPVKEMEKILPMCGWTISRRLIALGVSQEEIIYRGNKAAGKTKSKPIYQYDLYGNYIGEFSSRAEAEKFVGAWIKITPRFYGKVFGGYQWRGYKTDNIGVADWKQRKKKDKSKINSEKKPHERKIVQLSLEGEYIQTFESIKKAAQSINGNSDSICGACKGRNKTSFGFKWMYYEDWESVS